MPESSSARPTAATFQSAHPLAHRLYERVAARNGSIIVVGDGGGRNSRALKAAGLRVIAIPDTQPYTQLGVAPRSIIGALSTHAYLHGTTAKIRSGLSELVRSLAADAPAFLTFGSIRDVRYGFGDPLDEHTFAPGDGPEKGVPHAYFDHDAILEILGPLEVITAEEVEVDDIIGKWAHLDEEPLGKVHWFIEARKA